MSKVNQERDKALQRGDLGEEVEPGVFIRDLGTHRPEPSQSEVEQADPVKTLHQKPLHEREKLVEKLAAQLMDHYIAGLNDPSGLNPLRDGLPRCRRHPEWCSHGCKEGVLPRKMDHTLYDTFEWAKGVIARNYQELLRRQPGLRGRGTIIR